MANERFDAATLASVAARPTGARLQTFRPSISGGSVAVLLEVFGSIDPNSELATMQRTRLAETHTALKELREHTLANDLAVMSWRRAKERVAEVDGEIRSHERQVAELGPAIQAALRAENFSADGVESLEGRQRDAACRLQTLRNRRGQLVELQAEAHKAAAASLARSIRTEASEQHVAAKQRQDDAEQQLIAAVLELGCRYAAERFAALSMAMNDFPEPFLRLE